MDRLVRAISRERGLRLVYVDVTKTAKTLESRHLSGPAAARVLGEALVAAALLSATLKGEGERISFQLKVEGPVKGVIVDAGTDGGLRGYTDVKLLPELDEKREVSALEMLGSQGILGIIRSDERGVLYNGQIQVAPVDVRSATARYFNQSEQVPTGLEFSSEMQDFRIEMMRGLMVQKMPDADTEKFVEILEAMEDGRAKKALEGIVDLDSLIDLTGLPDLTLLEEKPLQFACRCSYGKCLEIMGSLRVIELQEILRKREPQRVTCHFCGETYRIKEDDISLLLLRKEEGISTA